MADITEDLTVKGKVIAKEISDGLAYAVGVQLSRHGKPYLYYSLYYDTAAGLS